MPTLDWIGKRAVVNHHRELPYRLLHCDPTLSAGVPAGAGDPAAGNLLVEGDNLHVLKALLPYYAGRVKCILIRPATPATKAGSITTTSTRRKSRSGSATPSARKLKTFRATISGYA